MTSTVNLLGLSLGICVCLAIYLIVQFEFSFEDHVPGKERVYRLVVNKTGADSRQTTITNIPFPAKAMLAHEITGIAGLASFHLFDYNGERVHIPQNGHIAKTFFSRGEIATAGSNFFTFFPTTVLAGRIRLDEPYQAVLTLTKARKYFGGGEPKDFIGKSIRYGDSLLVSVSAVIKDWPENTDFGFTDFISAGTAPGRLQNDWNAETEMLFVKLQNNGQHQRVAEQLKIFSSKYLNTDIKTKRAFALQPLSAIHFSTDIDYEGEFPFKKTFRPTLLGLSAIAIFILLLAIINFINLSTAAASARFKEFSIRRIIGGNRRQLMAQVLVETFLLAIISLILSVALMVPVLSVFDSYIPKGVRLSLLSPSLYIFFVLLTLLTTFLAGWFPAVRLAAVMPSTALKGTYTVSGNGLRKSLTVFQFAISCSFLFCAYIMGSQLHYIHEKGPGFNTDAIVTLFTGESSDTTGRVSQLAGRITQVRGVESVALQAFDPVSQVHLGIQLTRKMENETRVQTALQYANKDFISLYEMPLQAGRNFSNSHRSDELLINESAASMLGFAKPEGALGEGLYYGDQLYTVVGIIKDFHENSFHEPIRPLVIQHDASKENTIAVKLDTKGKNAEALTTTLSGIEAIWREYYPEKDFHYRFLDEAITQMYRKEQDMFDLINAGMFVTIGISCMGLFGLSVFTIRRRTKEIGIRKVLGASLTNLVAVLSREFLFPVVAGLVIASAVGWDLMNDWLNNFAYHVSITAWMFLAVAACTLAIGFVTIAFQSIKAARTNPVETLRN
jgi:ABC-type antimicrobial peptide transport system permease subunit